MPSIDFYVGTEPDAFWIGTLDSPEGEPSCLLENTELGRHGLTATDVVTYRHAVSALINETKDESTGWAKTRSDGWPWPDSSSRHTDWVIQFHHGRAWITVGYPIRPVDNADAPRPGARTDHPTAAPHATCTGHPDHAPHADQRAMLFALLRDAVDAVSEGDYPGSGLEEFIDDLRAIFNAYIALTDHSRPDNTATPTNPAPQTS